MIFNNKADQMNEVDQFVARQVSHQLGAFYADLKTACVPVSSLSSRDRFPSFRFFVWNAGRNQILDVNGGGKHAKFEEGQWRHSPNSEGHIEEWRNARFLNTVSAFARSGTYCVDLEDRRQLTTVDWPHSPGIFPVFQYNRRIRDSRAILWPLDDYHGIGNGYFLGDGFKDHVPFDMKKDSICWRGALAGNAFDTSKKILIAPDLIITSMNGDERKMYLRSISRYRLMEKYFDDPRFDVGFVFNSDSKWLIECDELARYAKEYLNKNGIVSHRYVLALAGHDNATSLYWMLSSKSLVLKEEYEWQTFVDCHIKPWVHYVPLESTLCDLEEKLAWCRSHVSQCKDMVASANKTCILLADQQLRNKILTEVVRHYETMSTYC